MKADATTEAAVKAALDRMAEAYAKRDSALLRAAFAPDSDVVMYGTGADEKRVGVAQEELDAAARELRRIAGLVPKTLPLSDLDQQQTATTGQVISGQKINACMVVVYFFGFTVTGLLMFFKGFSLLSQMIILLTSE